MIVLAWILAALATLVAVPIAIRLATRSGWVSRPRADRWGRREIALGGGIAIMAGAALSCAVMLGRVRVTSPADVAALIAAAIACFALGLADDRVTVTPFVKLLVQGGSGVVFVYLRWSVLPGWSPWIDFPVTFLWIVGITNALNLLDNMDGLAAGVTVIVCTACAVILWPEALGRATIAAAAGGAAAGFLPYNYRRARIYMGDAGSLPLGMLIAGLTLQAGRVAADSLHVAAAPLIPLLLAAVPIADTTLVTVCRLRAGRPVQQGGRDHMSHRLVYLGLSETGAVALLHLVTLTGAVAAVSLAAGRWLVGGTAAALEIAIVIGLTTFMGRVDPYRTETATAELPSRASMSLESSA